MSEEAPPGVTQGSWVLEVESPGPVWLGPDWFREQGIDADITQERIGLYLGKQAVPYLLTERPDGSGLFFYAREAPSRYASWTAYRLDLGRGAGQLMATGSVADAGPARAQEAGWTTTWREQDLEYRPQISAPEPWFWEPVYPRTRVTHTVELTQAVAGPITLTMRLWSRAEATSTNPAPSIWWDGEQIGTWQWDGPQEQAWPAVLSADHEQEEHVLEVELPGQSDAAAGRLWLDGFGVSSRRPLALSRPGITWVAEGEEAAVTGIAGAHLLDVTEPDAPLDLGVVAGERTRTQAGRHYWAGFPWLAPTPARGRPQTIIDHAALDEVEYLIIAPSPFWAALEPLVEHRQKQGLTISRVTPMQVYDSFGDGRPDPAAIRSLVWQLHDQGRLRYLLLLGDASAHPDGYAGEKGELLVVTDLVPTLHLHETPSDQTMITDKQGQPLIAVGRFPARTPVEVETMVQKTLQWEKTGPTSTVILSDDQPDFGHFVTVVGPLLPATTQQLDAAQADARSLVLEHLEEESTWLNYVGHGSLALWGDEKLLQREDEWEKAAVVTVWACLSAYFVHPEQDSLAEVWLRSAQGGAVAFVGPTGETYLHHQEPFAGTFYQEIQAGRSIGEALLAAWKAAGDDALDVVRSYLLLGDPALRLYAPPPE